MGIDQIFHEAFKSDALFRPVGGADVRCRNCDTKLKTYYAEERLFAVKCCYCETVSLVKANNPIAAAMCVGERKRGGGNAAD